MKFLKILVALMIVSLLVGCYDIDCTKQKKTCSCWTKSYSSGVKVDFYSEKRCTCCFTDYVIEEGERVEGEDCELGDVKVINVSCI